MTNLSLFRHFGDDPALLFQFPTPLRFLAFARYCVAFDNLELFKRGVAATTHSATAIDMVCGRAVAPNFSDMDCTTTKLVQLGARMTHKGKCLADVEAVQIYKHALRSTKRTKSANAVQM
jgi:hypothetical protein